MCKVNVTAVVTYFARDPLRLYFPHKPQESEIYFLTKPCHMVEILLHVPYSIIIYGNSANLTGQTRKLSAGNDTNGTQWIVNVILPLYF